MPYDLLLLRCLVRAIEAHNKTDSLEQDAAHVRVCSILDFFFLLSKKEGNRKLGVRNILLSERYFE